MYEFEIQINFYNSTAIFSILRFQIRLISSYLIKSNYATLLTRSVKEPPALYVLRQST